MKGTYCFLNSEGKERRGKEGMWEKEFGAERERWYKTEAEGGGAGE